MLMCHFRRSKAIASIRIIICILIALASLSAGAAYKGIQFVVDQPLTGKNRSWTHVIPEDGDYQIGAAWIETKSGNEVALEVFKNGSEQVLSKYVQVGKVTRFETRIEGLIAGDVLTVRIRADGGIYRAGYQVAHCTPTFAGLPVFDVHAPIYGAIGDGETDDFLAIQAAVQAAVNEGGGIVQFDGSKTYRAIGKNDMTLESLIELVSASNVKISGNGASIILHPPDRLALVDSSHNVQIDGLTVTYDPLPYYQGTIDSIDVNNRTVSITVPARYDIPIVGPNTHRTYGGFYGFTFIPNATGSRSGWNGKHLHLESTATIGGNPRKIKLQARSDMGGVLQHALDNGATEVVVPDIIYGHRGLFSLEISNSSRVKVSNLLCHMMLHLGIGPNENVGPITFSNVDLVMANPETELFWSWRGGYSIVGNNRWGLLIEDGEWNGNAMYDDVLAVYTRRQEILGKDGTTLNLKLGQYAHLFRVGDWVSIWSTPEQNDLLGMSRIVEAGSRLADGSFNVTLESIPEGSTLHDILINEELYNKNTLIRNCRNFPEGASNATTRLRTGGHFLNCHFEGLYLITEFANVFEPVRARNLVVENCFIGSNQEKRIRLTRAINPRIINSTLEDTYILGNQGAEDIYLDGNEWTNMSGDIATLFQMSSTSLFGQSTRNGESDGLPGYVSLYGSSTIDFSQPWNYPEAIPPQAEPVVVPGTPVLTSSSGQGYTSLDWTEVQQAQSYEVYRAISFEGPYHMIVRTTNLHHADATGVLGGQYFYAVTSVDLDGDSSFLSNRVSGNPSGTQLPPVADSYVQGGVYANSNFGSSTDLSCKTDGNELYTRQVYMQFDLSGLSGIPLKAELHLKVSQTTGSGDTHRLLRVLDDAWNETALTWNNKPESGIELASAGSPEAGDWIVFDLTDALREELQTDNLLSLTVISSGNELVNYTSRESTEVNDRPVLRFALSPPDVAIEPLNLVANADGTGNVFLQWEISGSPGGTNFRLFRRIGMEGTWRHLVDTSSLNFVDTDVEPDQLYAYKVVVVANNGLQGTEYADASTSGTTPPFVTGFSPGNGADFVVPQNDFTITFSEPVFPNSGNISFKNLTDGNQAFTHIPVTDLGQVSFFGPTLTLDPLVPLEVGKEYAIRIDAGSVQDVYGNHFAGINDDTTWNFSIRALMESKLVNGDFAANATEFSTNNGYRGLENPFLIQGWSFRMDGLEGATGINGTGIYQTFGPSEQSTTGYYVFLQHGGTHLSQNLSGRLRPNRTYNINYLAANRSINPGAMGRVRIADENTIYYDSGDRIWSNTAFESRSEYFTTDSTFEGPVILTLSNVSDEYDQTVNFRNVSVVEVSDYLVWSSGFPDADLSNPSGDFDKDGISNEAEWAFGLDPTTGNSCSPLSTTAEQGAIVFVYTRRNPLYHDNKYVIWTSTDLERWNRETGAIEWVEALGNSVEKVSVFLGIPPEGEAHFMRVSAETNLIP